MLNSRDINLLRSDVAYNVRKFLDECKRNGLEVLITGTVRDEEYQLKCYKDGYSKSKVPSFHGVKAGLAFDICKNVKGQEYSDLDFFLKCGEIGQKIGFEWGGTWKNFIDRPHFQWSGINYEYTSKDILKGNYPPTMPKWEGDIEVMENVYNWTTACPEWAIPTIQKLLNKGYLKGDDKGQLGLNDTMLRLLVINDRAGLYG